ncbi:putative N6-adenine methyltransferase-domain-containing protein [Terfezia claveryi]|nr:putative N6-adenine methyltransferase-domain-containing protein [Terfezia claveryi]
MDLFSEDWQMSQFWYDQSTQLALAEELTFADFQFRTRPAGTFTTPVTEPSEPINVAIVSAPSVFVHLLSLQRNGVIPKHIHPTLLEFDSRFSLLCPLPLGPSAPRFVEYDFNHPLRLPSDLQGKFDSVLVDPPFLSAECQAGAAVTVRWLLKKTPEGVSPTELEKGVGRRVIVCTGERVAQLVERYYAKEGVRETEWNVVHERGLSNPFSCFSSYQGKRWQWKTIEDADL